MLNSPDGTDTQPMDARASIAADRGAQEEIHSAPQIIALRMLEGFDKHYRLFRETSAGARRRFDDGDWVGVQRAVKERIQFFDARVQETVERLGREFHADQLDHRTWQQVKLEYIGLLTQHKQPELAETLRIIAKKGRDGFYKGDVAKDMVDKLRAVGGLHTMEDFEDSRPEYVTPISTKYRGHDVYEIPPNGQGITALIMMNVLQGYDYGSDRYSQADRLHLLSEAARHAYRLRNRYVADMGFADVPVDRLVSKAYADERRGLMDPQRAVPWDRIPEYGSLAGDTVFIATVDGEGNAVSLIHSLYGGFGAAVVAGNTGDATTMMFAWILGAVISIMGALCYAELASAHPNAGGEYHFLERAYGLEIARLFAWARMTVIATGSIALFAFLFADYATQILRLGEYSNSIYASLLIIVLTAINIIGLGAGKWTQNLLTLIEASGLVLVMVVGFLFPAPAAAEQAVELGDVARRVLQQTFDFLLGKILQDRDLANDLRGDDQHGRPPGSR